MFRLLGGNIPDDGILTNTLAAALIDADGRAEIPSGYTSIANSAFQSTDLISVTIPDSVTNIEEHAFNGCTSLTSVIIGDRVETIGDYAFFNCNSLTFFLPIGVFSASRSASFCAQLLICSLQSSGVILLLL